MRALPDGAHVRLQLHHHAAGIFQLPEPGDRGGDAGGKAGIQIHPAVVVHQNARVKGEGFPGPLAPEVAVRKGHMTVKLKPTRRLVTHCHSDTAHKIKGIIQVIAPIRPLHHVRRIQATPPAGIHGILFLAVNNTLKTPVGQILFRGGPAHIIVHAEQRPAEAVMGTIYIYPAAEHTGFAVRHIFPAGQIGVASICFHLRFSLDCNQNSRGSSSSSNCFFWQRRTPCRCSLLSSVHMALRSTPR